MDCQRTAASDQISVTRQQQRNSSPRPKETSTFNTSFNPPGDLDGLDALRVEARWTWGQNGEADLIMYPKYREHLPTVQGWLLQENAMKTGFFNLLSCTAKIVLVLQDFQLLPCKVRSALW